MGPSALVLLVWMAVISHGAAPGVPDQAEALLELTKALSLAAAPQQRTSSGGESTETAEVGAPFTAALACRPRKRCQVGGWRKRLTDDLLRPH